MPFIEPGSQRGGEWVAQRPTKSRAVHSILFPFVRLSPPCLHSCHSPRDGVHTSRLIHRPRVHPPSTSADKPISRTEKYRVSCPIFCSTKIRTPGLRELRPRGPSTPHHSA